MNAALFQIIIALLPTVKVGVEHLVAWLGAYRQAAQQTGEWIPEQETAYQASLRKYGPEHLPDPPTSPVTSE